MPTPYRRACGHCIRSKRRCDLAVPRCHRCEVRSLDCHYQNANPGPENEDPGHVDHRAIPIFEDYSQLTQDSLLNPVVSGGDIDMAMDILSANSPIPLPDSTEWWDEMANIEQLAVPDRLEINSTPSNRVLSGQKYQQRIIYALQRLKLLPSLFAMNGKNIFIHKNLYDAQIPEVLGDIMTLCALYDTKSEANEDMVYRIIGQKSQRLQDGFDVHAPALEFLASIQALILIQIIRLFDGDIRQRAEAERTQSVLLAYIRVLQHKMQAIGDSWRTELISQKETADAWNSWLYAESVRRTVIIGHMLDGLYCFLKQGWDESHDSFMLLSFFAQKDLWDASSKYQWEMAVNQKNACPIHFASWDVSIQDVSPGDLDDLGMMMTALMKGVDHCRYWVGPQLLDKFGLQP